MEERQIQKLNSTFNLLNSSLLLKKMAASNTKTSFHARSNSLPSRPHPIVLQCDEHLDRLRSSNETSSSSSLSHKLGALQDLHECVEKLVQLPLTQEALLHEPQESCVNDELLDGSLRLLDVCTTAKDSLLHTKECMRELQSIIRRKRGEELDLTSEAKKFLSCRKVVRKAIFKALRDLKSIAKKGNLKDQQNMALVSLLKDVEVATLSTFESLLNFISGTKPSSWSLVSKLINTKRISCQQVADENEFSQLDAALQSSVLQMTNKSDSINNLQNKLEKLESCIQDLEEGLEFLFRRLIKIRVSLLNILTN